MSIAVLPGATIGVLGSGQLGRMFAIAARRLGYRVHTFSPETDTPTGQVADLEIQADYTDLDAVINFARGVSVVTFEFENVPAATAEAAAGLVPVRPAGQVLHVAQNRLREKTFLARHGFPVTPFAAVASVEDLGAAIDQVGLPAVLKSSAWGYDGKGQFKIENRGQAEAAFSALQPAEAVLEAFIELEAEVSVLGARDVRGEVVLYPTIHNWHARHILDLSCCPAQVPGFIAREAETVCRGVLEALDVVGLLCVEYFVTRDGRLMINELAPRPHNSGHLTIDAFTTCQFEQQLRAVCGLPLGNIDLLRPAAMANLLGDLWERGEPNWAAALAANDVKLHLYGKTAARVGRKMGHLTALGPNSTAALHAARAARDLLLTPVDRHDFAQRASP